MPPSRRTGSGFTPLRLVAAGIAVVGVLYSVYAFHNSRLEAKHHVESRFERDAGIQHATIEHELNRYLHELEALGRFLQYSESITKQSFDGFTASMLASRPGPVRVQWAPKVLAADREAFEARAREVGYPQFVIQDFVPEGDPHPSYRRDYYFPIQYINPSSKSGLELGYDFLTHGVNKATFELAAASNKTLSTVPYPLFMGKASPGSLACLLICPVKEVNAGPGSGDFSGVRGFAVSIFKLSEIAESSQTRGLPAGFSFRIIDRSIRGERVICTTEKTGSGPSEPELLTATKEVLFAGRDWKVVYIADVSYAAPAHLFQPWILLLAGVSITVLSSFVVSYWGRRREDKLHSARELLRAIFESTPVCIKITDIEGRVLDMNGFGIRLLGAGALADVQGKLISQIIPDPTERATYMEILEDAARGKAHSMTLDIITFQGVRRTVFTQLQPMYGGSEGDPVKAVLSATRDITDEATTSQALKESEQLYRSLVSALDEGVVVQDRDSRIITTNDAAARILQIPTHELTNLSSTGTPWECYDSSGERMTGEMHPSVVASKTGKPVRDFVMGIRRKDGSLAWLSINSQPLFSPDGKTVHSTVTSFRDITYMKRAMETLHERETRLNSLFDNPIIGIGYTDDQKRWTEVNDRLCEMLGYSRSELLRLTWRELTHPDDITRNLEFHDELVAGRIHAYTMEKRYIRKDGAAIHTLLAARGVRNLNGDLAYAVSVIQDISGRIRAEDERRVLEQKMQEAQRLESLGILAGGIAHDFNNILTGIFGNATLARLSIPESSKAGDSLSLIEEAAARAADLCQQMLAYAGKGAFVKREVSLSDLVQDTARLLNVSISKNAKLVLQLDPELPPTLADEAQLRQIIMNLIINASESFGEGPGVIDVTTCTRTIEKPPPGGEAAQGFPTPGTYVVLEVKDNGCGMSQEIQARIFEPFFTTKFTGRGLGLSAVMGIVRSHDATIHLKSAPGAGTTFTIYFKPAAGPVPARGARGSGKQLFTPIDGEFLVVDDEAQVREVVAGAIQVAGGRVHAAKSGIEGVRILKERAGKIRIAIIDLTMPGLGGEETAREILSIDPQVRIILMSGYSAGDAARRISDRRVRLFLQKPFKPEALIDAVAASLRTKSDDPPAAESIQA